MSCSFILSNSSYASLLTSPKVKSLQLMAVPHIAVNEVLIICERGVVLMTLFIRIRNSCAGLDSFGDSGLTRSIVDKEEIDLGRKKLCSSYL